MNDLRGIGETTRIDNGEKGFQQIDLKFHNRPSINLIDDSDKINSFD
jgi:hypothetical protein